MIERYTLPEMGAVWTEEAKMQAWLDVEIAAVRAWQKLGKVPAEAVAEIEATARFDVARVAEIELTTNHDVIAFLTNVAEHVGDASKWVHYGMTSSDMLDTGLALQMKHAGQLLERDLLLLGQVLKRRALEFQDTVQVGRTHGIHAEPITFGFKLAGWYAQILRDIERTKSARKAVGVGKVSGAVGIYANIDPRIERYVCDKLGLEPAEHSTQIVARDRHAQFLTALAIIAGSLESFATELRNLQRTEILEAQEYFAKGQKGSSAMPHKRNPRLSEQVAGLARVVRSNAFPALENIVTWHERDLTNSSVERIIIPDSCILVDYLLNTFAKVVERLIIYPENMMRNLELMGGLVFSERVMLRLVEKGLSREDAYTVVQENAAKAWEGQSFRAALESDPRVASALSKAELAEIFDYKHHIRNVDAIFERLGI